jgi:hypothetical protein
MDTCISRVQTHRASRKAAIGRLRVSEQQHPIVIEKQQSRISPAAYRRYGAKLRKDPDTLQK